MPPITRMRRRSVSRQDSLSPKLGARLAVSRRRFAVPAVLPTASGRRHLTTSTSASTCRSSTCAPSRIRISSRNAATASRLACDSPVRGTAGTLSVYGSRYHDFIESRVNIGVDPDTGTTLFQSQQHCECAIYGAEAALDMALGAWRPRTRELDRPVSLHLDGGRGHGAKPAAQQHRPATRPGRPGLRDSFQKAGDRARFHARCSQTRRR